MNKFGHEVGNYIVLLLNRAKQNDSRLGWRLQNDSFFTWIENTSIALITFYRLPSSFGDAEESFTKKLFKWLEHPPESFMGLVGEMKIADRLRRANVPHRFIPESKTRPYPDIELTIMGTRVYFEITTFGENNWLRIHERLWEQLPVTHILIRDWNPKPNQEEALFRVALTKAWVRIRKGWGGPIEYKGDQGEFDLTFRTRVVWGPRIRTASGWPDSRMKDGVPYLEFWLKEKLAEKIAQFQVSSPTFLVFVNYDLLINDVALHASRVLEQHGQTMFDDVAGIISDDSFENWAIIDNQAPKYRQLTASGLHAALRAMGGQ